jgi:RHS repeat-associated protein
MRVAYASNLVKFTSMLPYIHISNPCRPVLGREAREGLSSQVGDVINLTAANGTSEGRYRYTQPYRLSTKYRDKEVETTDGLYYYGYRWYLPSIGRWPSRDPIVERGGRNLFAMVGNNSVSKYDLLGKWPMGPSPGGYRFAPAIILGQLLGHAAQLGILSNLGSNKTCQWKEDKGGKESRPQAFD